MHTRIMRYDSGKGAQHMKKNKDDNCIQTKNPPKIIAEIGCNHKGEMATAREMIMAASLFCKADVVKFQKRTPKELLSDAQYNAPHPNPGNSYGTTYGEHREFLELDLIQHNQLNEWCNEFGIEYSTSVWDLTAAKEIITIAPSIIKVPSACNLNWPMLDYICKNHKGEIHLSLGIVFLFIGITKQNQIKQQVDSAARKAFKIKLG